MRDKDKMSLKYYYFKKSKQDVLHFKKKNISKIPRAKLYHVTFMFSKKATKIDEIFTIDLTFTTKRQIDGEYFINFCGLLRKHEL